MRRRRLIIALVGNALLAPLVVIACVPGLLGRCHAFVVARQLKTDRDRALEKLTRIGRPAIDGVLPRVAAALAAHWEKAPPFIGDVRWRDDAHAGYDYVERFSEVAEYKREGFTPGILCEIPRHEDALHAKSGHRHFVCDDYVIAVDDPALEAAIIAAVRETVKHRSADRKLVSRLVY